MIIAIHDSLGAQTDIAEVVTARSDYVCRTMTPSFDRYEATGLASLTPLLRGRGGGIYVLEFVDGTQYVGQAVNFIARMTTHLRGGGKQHEPWLDVVAVSVMNVPLNELNTWERRIIEQRRAAGVLLRNKVFNFGFLGPSAFDHSIPVKQQTHWATGGGNFEIGQYAEAARRPAGPVPKLFRSPEGAVRRQLDDGRWASRAELVLWALARIVSQVIPAAPRLEGDYWTLSDNPSTGGGRFATLNVGGLELAYFPRRSPYPDDEFGPIDVVVLNLPAGTILRGPRPELGQGDMAPGELVCFPSGDPCIARPGRYSIADTDVIEAPTLELLSCDWGIAQTLRSFSVDIMRANNSRKFTRHHSPELARRVYEEIALGG